MSSEKIAINLLTTKHAELSAEFKRLLEKADQVSQGIRSIENCLLVIDPDFKLEAIKPKRRYNKLSLNRQDFLQALGLYVRTTDTEITVNQSLDFVTNHLKSQLNDSEKKRLHTRLYHAIKRLEKSGELICLGRISSKNGEISWQRSK